MSCQANDLPGVELDYRDLDKLFSEKSVTQTWLDVERHVAEAQAELGLIPEGAAKTIAKKSKYSNLDLNRIAKDAATTKHPLMPLINELVRLCGPIDGGYVHWGITTQNVIQTSSLYLAQKAHTTIEGFFTDLLRKLGSLALEHDNTIMAGRTHSRHAVPITFGFKIAVWIEELIQAMERLQDAKKRAFVVMMGGAVGCHSALEADGPAFQKLVAQRLDMGEMAIPSRAIRTHICEYANALILMASVCHRIAEEVYRASSEEFGELNEGLSDGVVGSSTMPQKLNPILCSQIIANSNKLYPYAGMMLGMVSRPFESDASSNTIFENGLGQLIELFASVLVPTEALISDLVVNSDRMRENLVLSGGTIHSEFLMMELAKALGKHQGHEVAKKIATAATAGKKEFLEAVSDLPQSEAILPELQNRLAGSSAVGLCAEFAQFFGRMAKSIDPTSLPSASQRSLGSIIKEQQ